MNPRRAPDGERDAFQLQDFSVATGTALPDGWARLPQGRDTLTMQQPPEPNAPAR